MQEELLLSALADTFVEKPKYTFTIQVAKPKRSFWQWITRKPVELSRDFVITPCKVENMARVAGSAILFPKEIAEGTHAEVTIPLMLEHKDRMVYLVAAAIQNDDNEPSASLIRFLKRNCDSIDLMEAVSQSLDGLELTAFLNTIVLAKGSVNFLKPASPIEGRELIASHTESSEAHVSISDGH